MSTKINPPSLTKSKHYELYKQELLAWREVTDLAKGKQGVAIALSLPEESETKIREKVFDQIELAELKKDDGFDTLVAFLDKHLAKDDLTDSLEKFEEFEDYQRIDSQSVSEYIAQFDSKYRKIEKKKMTLPPEILAFKLLRKANITKEEKMLVLTGMNYENKDTLYDEAKKSLKKFKGEVTEGAAHGSTPSIKLEPTFLAQNEEALLAAGYVRAKQGGRFNSTSQRVGGRSGRGGFARGTYNNRGSPMVNVNKNVNPVGADGLPITCKSCGSFRHLVAKCPDSWENLSKVNITEEENVVLFTGYKTDEISQLGVDARNCAVLDSACSSTVCGETWLENYIGSLDDAERKKVTKAEGSRIFKFGGGTKLKSKCEYSIPGEIAGTSVTIQTDVVDSDIPLLLSRSAMKNAGVKLDLQNDTAEILGKDVSLNLTSSGHYCIPIDKSERIPVETVCEVTFENSHKQLLKLHRQFAHPPAKRLKALLCDAGSWKEEHEKLLTDIENQCELCKVYSRTPSRPVVGMPMAKEFNEKVAMDLKQWKGRWILHMIDMWSRYTISIFISRKRPSDVIDCMMKNWVAIFGVMGSIMTDNGGEFSSDETREIASILNVKLCTTAGESPFQNGLCERNHAVVDMMLNKLEAENPNTENQTLLSWANMAKNSLQMWNGFSSHQLIFGQNPNLPGILKDALPSLEGTTSSEKFAKHLNALHKARNAFMETEASERIRRALRAKVRAAEQKFDHGEPVYYKREGKERWLGPGKVIFQDGKVVFVRHGGVFVRVSPNRLKKLDGYLGVPHDDITLSKECEEEPGNPDNDMKPAVTEKIQSDTVKETPNVSGSRKPALETVSLKTGDKIQYKIDNEWKNAEITSRAGKATGKYVNWYNVKDSDGDTKSIDLEKLEWKPFSENEIIIEESDSSVVFSVKSDDNVSEIVKAQQTELEKLTEFDTYEEVQDNGQNALSTRWVITNKDSKVKARLVVRGFEEATLAQSDSPTVGKGTMRIFLSVAAMNKWTVKTTDIKSAFLQGKELEREVFVKPPKESRVKSGIIWKLKHGLYGLKDGARQFYLSVREELLSLGFSQCEIDPAMFYIHSKGELQGLICCHVDDFLHAGNSHFEEHMKKLTERFSARKLEEKNFTYIGFSVHQQDDNIRLDHSDYVMKVNVKHIELGREINQEDILSENEQSLFRQMVGKLNWIVQGSRPDMAFEMVVLSTKLKQAQVKDLKRVSKTIRRLQEIDSLLTFPNLLKESNLKIILFTDASLGNVSNGTGSTGAYILWIMDQNGNCCPISWQANKIKRVVRSTIAAEALSLQEGIEAGIYYRHMLASILNCPTNSVHIHVFIDNKSVIEAVFSTKLVDDKRLRIDVASIQEEIRHGDIKHIHWVPGNLQLANVMTKQGASSVQLLKVLHTGKMIPEILKTLKTAF